MPADGSIIIDTRVNSKGAEADLKALQAKAKSTAQQISALDKQLNTATSKRSKLTDDLAAAKQQAEATAKALDEVLAKLDAARDRNLADVKKEFPHMSAANTASVAEIRTRANSADLIGESDRLVQQLAQQEEKAAQLNADYQAQNATLQKLNAQHQALTAQLEKENAAVSTQAQIVSQMQADDAIQSYFAKQESAVNRSFAVAEKRQERLTGYQDDPVRHAEAVVQATQREVAAQEKAAKAAAEQAARSEAAASALSNQERATRGTSLALSRLSAALDSMQKFGAAVFRPIEKGIRSFSDGLKRAQRAIRSFNTRLMGIVSGALVFNLISAGLRNMTSYMGQALTASSALRTALGNLSGAAQTAAAPLIQVLTPALTALANAAATVFSYIAKLVAFLTGTTVSAAQQAAAGVSGVGSAASDTAKDVDKATRSLAGFDEITRLDAPQDTSTGGGGGGGASAITPNFDFEGKSPFLDSLLTAIEAGDWYQVGELIGEKLRDSLNAIPWPDIQEKASNWATNLATALNGVVETPGLWEAIGHTLAQGLNTALTFYDQFMQNFRWKSLGVGLANGLSKMTNELQWDTLGRSLTDGLRAALLTLHGFISTYDDWETLGTNLATMLISAVNNVDWVQAAGDLGELAIGLLTTINTMLEEIPWDEVGQKVIDMIKAVDWATLFQQLGELLNNIWPVVLAAILIPAIINFVTGTVIPAANSALGSLVATIVSAIGGWPAVLIGVLMLGLAAIGAAVAQWLYEHWDELTAWFDEKWAEFSESWAEFWNTVFEKGKEIWNNIRDAWQDFWENLSNKFNEMRTNITAAWNEFWLQVSNKAREIWNNIQSDWQNFWSNVFSKFNTMKANLSQAWNSLWTGMRDKVGEIWNGIVEKVRGGANSVLGFINGLISKVVNGINGMIDALNSLSFDVPEWLGGGTFGFSIGHINAPQIPYLAQGAVIPPNREFLAVLGDQSSGTNIEAPLSTIEQAVANVLENQLAGQMAGFEAVVAALREVRQAIYDTELTEAGVGRAAQRWQRRQAIMQGV